MGRTTELWFGIHVEDLISLETTQKRFTYFLTLGFWLSI